MKLLRGIFKAVISLALLLVMLTAGVYIFVRAKYGIDLWNTVGQLKAISKSVDESEVCPDAFVAGDYTSMSGYNAMKKAIATLGDRMPHGIFVANDPMAVGALKAIQEAKINVPNRIALISFNDTAIVKYVYPSMSAVHVATDEMAHAAVDMMIKRLQNPNNDPCKTVVGTHLIKRQTTR